MTIRSIRLGLVFLLLAGCGEGGNSDPVDAGKGGWSIPAGVYGNVERGDGSGELGGIELSLDRGSESETVDFVRCEGRCDPVEKRSVHRGLNGISFTIYGAGRPVDVMVTPDGVDAVELNVDRGNGLESYRLPRIKQEFGLAAAQRETDGTTAPSAYDAPLVPSSPPPLPSPTP